MKISVITATYNSGRTLAAALDSLVAQRGVTLELIVVDGASTDNTAAIVANYGHLVSQFVSEPDAGIYDALNKGLALARGEVVGFLHSDDVLAHPQVLANIAATFMRERCDAVYGNLEYVAQQDVNKVVRYWHSGAYQRCRLRHGWMPPHPTFYLKRCHYQQYGGFDCRYRIAADYDSMLRYLYLHHCHAVFLNEVLVKMRVGGASNRSLVNMVQKTKEDYLVLKRNGLAAGLGVLQKNLSKVPQFFQRERDVS
ncbi:MAG: glycosyltransferase family 2 protein [Ferrimonas sp.]